MPSLGPFSDDVSHDHTEYYTVGNAKITRVTEHLIGIPAASLFPDYHTEFATVGVSGDLPLSTHSWIVRTPTRLIVSDTSIGNARDRDRNPLFDHLHTDFLERLADAGAQREAVDIVVMTHMHIDHVGWNTYREDGRWQSDSTRRYVSYRGSATCCRSRRPRVWPRTLLVTSRG